MSTKFMFPRLLAPDDWRWSRLLAPYGLWWPTPQDVIDRMLALAAVTAKDVVYDLRLW